MSDTKTLLVVRDGTAVDAILVPADATVGKNGTSAAWDDADFPAPAGSTFVDQPDAAIGWRLDKGRLVAPPPPVDPPLTPEQLAALKASLKVQVDSAAEALRLTLITPGSGQAMEYQEAYAQAQAALGATDAVEPAAYPMLAATIGVDIDPEGGKPATDVLGVARSVKAAYEAYLQAGAAIRGARLLAKVEIDAAPDADHARAVFGAIQWPALSA